MKAQRVGVMFRKFNLQRGDTLTEVMFATAVAALVIVIAITAMNRSLAQTQASVESTFVRQSIDAEGELLRYARDQYKADPEGAKGKPWRDVLAQAAANTDGRASKYGTCPGDAGFASDSFFITDNLASPTVQRVSSISPAASFQPPTYADIGHGIWVEAIKSPPSVKIPYVDLHIRACWDPPYDGPKALIGTIIRLYYATDNPDAAPSPIPPVPITTNLSFTPSNPTLQFCSDGAGSTVNIDQADFNTDPGTLSVTVPPGFTYSNAVSPSGDGTMIITAPASALTGIPPSGRDYTNNQLILTNGGGVTRQTFNIRISSAPSC